MGMGMKRKEKLKGRCTAPVYQSIHRLYMRTRVGQPTGYSNQEEYYLIGFVPKYYITRFNNVTKDYLEVLQKKNVS